MEGRQRGARKTPLRGLDVRKKRPVAERVKHKCKTKKTQFLAHLHSSEVREKVVSVIFVMGFLIRHSIYKN